MSEEEKSETQQQLATCKSCNSSDIYKDDLVCQAVKTKDIILMPMFICKGCGGGMVVAPKFQEFSQKILKNLLGCRKEVSGQKIFEAEER